MIYYDSHKVGTLLRWHGSVFPTVLKKTSVLTAMVFVVKYLETLGLFGVYFADLDLVANSAVYSGFSFTLGFILVFRTSQSYNRFWVSATSVNVMRAQWSEAAAGLVTFAEMSKSDRSQILKFQHQVVRLFSMLHATALSAIACMEDERFAILDLEAFNRTDLDYMYRKKDVQKVEVVYQWISSLIVKRMSEGFLNVPPPILTRVFQEMEKGMIEFQSLLQIMNIPFPFPYAQVTFVLILVHTVITPFVMVLWTSTAWCAAIFTFISHICILTVDHIATELENPFGDDVNDLPVHDFHDAFNETMALLLDPAANIPPELRADAALDYRTVSDVRKTVSLEMLYAGQEDAMEEKLGQPGGLQEAKPPQWTPAPMPPAERDQGTLVEVTPPERELPKVQRQPSEEIQILVQQLLTQLLQGQASSGPQQRHEPDQGHGAAARSPSRPSSSRHQSHATFDELLKKQEVVCTQFLATMTQVLNRMEAYSSDRPLFSAQPFLSGVRERVPLVETEHDPGLAAPASPGESAWKRNAQDPCVVVHAGRTLPCCFGVQA